MAKVLITEGYLSDIADAIREKKASEDTYTPAEMADAIESIQTGTAPTGTINISTNGNHDVTDYANANVSVPTGTARSSSDLTASNLTVTAPAGLYAENATKTLSDQNLVAGNIKKDVTIFGTTGTYEGGGGGGATIDDLANGSWPTGDITITGTTIADYAFTSMTRITGVYGPNVTSIGRGAFSGAGIKSAVFPSVTTMGIQAFQSNTSLLSADFGINTSSIPNSAFWGCSGLVTLVLRKSDALVSIGTNVINNATVTVYIPETLYSHLGDGTSLDYQNATNWSGYYTNGRVSFAKIEGTTYATHYADGTLIPT